MPKICSIGHSKLGRAMPLPMCAPVPMPEIDIAEVHADAAAEAAAADAAAAKAARAWTADAALRHAPLLAEACVALLTLRRDGLLSRAVEGDTTAQMQALMHPPTPPMGTGVRIMQLAPELANPGQPQGTETRAQVTGTKCTKGVGTPLANANGVNN